MPNPTQTREKRIQRVVKRFEGFDLDKIGIDPLIKWASEEFPTVRRQTIRTYAEAAFHTLKGGA